MAGLAYITNKLGDDITIHYGGNHITLKNNHEMHTGETPQKFTFEHTVAEGFVGLIFPARIGYLIEQTYQMDHVVDHGRFVVDGTGLRPEINHEYFTKWSAIA